VSHTPLAEAVQGEWGAASFNVDGTGRMQACYKEESKIAAACSRFAASGGTLFERSNMVSD
jgi:hypothetical protein